MEELINELKSKERFNIDDLVNVVIVLRSENGCPWDKVQTHKSIKKDFLEEVYEVMEAIDCDSPEMMREELGDVLLQVVFHTVIEQEQEHFVLEDVITELCQKLIIRHPHVFGDVQADTVDKVLTNWDSIKKETKGQETYTDTLKSVPKNFPALMRAQKLGKRSSRARDDFSHDKAGQLKAWDLLNAESNSLREAIADGNEDQQKEALGDLLFACCNMARALGLDAEEALSESSERYIKRFEKAESKGEKMSDINFDDLDILWRNGKES